MDLQFIYSILGFTVAAYAVIGNDSIQTLGTFLASNKKRKWYTLAAAASLVLIATLSIGWYFNGGDISFGRLEKFDVVSNLSPFFVFVPVVILYLTKYGLPISTTFLILSIFSSKDIIYQMIFKSVAGYVIAFIFAYFVWVFLFRVLSKKLHEHKFYDDSKWWTIAQWVSTGFLFSVWLQHDVANIAVYLPRTLSMGYLLFVLTVLVACIFIIFRKKGGPIQNIVLSKTGTRFIQNATIIDFVYAIVLIIFKEMSSIPMSTTWVFIGLLAGREIAMAHKIKNLQSVKSTLPMIFKDLIKVFLGLSISLIVAVIVGFYV